MVYKPEDDSEVVATVPVNDKSNPHPAGDSVSAADKENGQESKKKQSTEDLFNAHDFDITIDLEVPIPSKFRKKLSGIHLSWLYINFYSMINKENEIYFIYVEYTYLYNLYDFISRQSC